MGDFSMYLIAAFQIGTLPLTELSRPIAVIKLEISPVKNELFWKKTITNHIINVATIILLTLKKSNIRLTGFKLL